MTHAAARRAPDGFRLEFRRPGFKRRRLASCLVANAWEPSAETVDLGRVRHGRDIRRADLPESCDRRVQRGLQLLQRDLKTRLQMFPTLLAGRPDAVPLALGIGPASADLLDRAHHLVSDLGIGPVDLIEQPLDLDRHLPELCLYLPFERFFSAHPKLDTVSTRPEGPHSAAPQNKTTAPWGGNH
jgi:hypothetical protein